MTLVGFLRDGSFNIWGNTFPAEALPAAGVFTVAGVPFLFPSKDDGACNNVVCAGQLVTIEPGRYDWLFVLGAAERRSEDVVHLHFEGGGSDPEWLRLSDFWPETAPRFGEVEAVRCPSMHYPRHVQRTMRPVIWQQRVPVTRRATLVGVRLPDNPAIHLFAATLARTPGCA